MRIKQKQLISKILFVIRFYTFTKLLQISNENYEDNLNLFFSTKENFSSNGYAEFILNEYIKEFLFDKNYKIERKLGKNSDYKEIFLYVGNESLPVLSFCIIYGFRNIQNILRLKNKIKYSYIEIMACPGGCINGGGQMRPKNQTESARDVLKKIEENVCLKSKQIKKYAKSFVKLKNKTKKKDLISQMIFLF